MFLPEEINELFENFVHKVYEEKALDTKTKQLIAIACSVMADCIPCLKGHYKKAVEAGATKEEISEALAVATSIAAGSKRAKNKEVVDLLETENY